MGAEGAAIAADTGDATAAVIVEQINVTDDWHLMPGQPLWTPDGRTIYFTAGIGGSTHLFHVPIGGGDDVGSVEQITTGERRLNGVSFDRGFSKIDLKRTRLNSSHLVIPYAVFSLTKK